jgi:hypothetical protein
MVLHYGFFFFLTELIFHECLPKFLTQLRLKEIEKASQSVLFEKENQELS